jgi:cell wall-associated NlpC family hydrolase
LGHSSKRSRRGAIASAVVALALLAAAPPVAAAADSPFVRDTRTKGTGDGPLAALGRAAVRAIGTAGADDAIDRFGQSLALLAAQKRVAAAEARRAEQATRAPAEPKIDYSNIDDPSELPPASAGTNGNEYEQRAKNRGDSGELFARTPVAGDPESTAILLTGIALAPPNAPEAVKGAINNANTIVGRPYIWGGGHGSWYSHGYDCSGAVSFALFGGGLIPRPLTSGELEGWGAPGPGKWITVYANAGHTWATIAGLRWDTSGTESGTGPRWHVNTRPAGGFVVRHPPGL